MNKYEKALTHTLGLSHKEAQVYMAILELGETDASSIAKKAGLKRTTVYNILPGLVSSGLIKKSLNRGKTKFYVDSLKKLETLLEEKSQTIKSIIPDLMELQGDFFNKPRITVYEGAEGVREIYKDFITSSSPGDIVLSYAGTRDHYKYLSKDFLLEFVDKRVARKVRLRLIAGKSNLSEELKNNGDKFLREVKTMEDKNFDFFGEVIICMNRVAFISYKENYLGVVIESKEITAMHMAAFNSLWEKL